MDKDFFIFALMIFIVGSIISWRFVLDYGNAVNTAVSIPLSQALFLFSVFLAFLVPTIVVLRGYRYWKKFGLDPKITAEQEKQLFKLRPAIAGVVLQEKAGLKEIVATIADLAQGNYIEIREPKDFFSKGLELTRTNKSDADLLDYEKGLLRVLFAEKQKISLEEIENDFFTLGKFKKVMQAINEEAAKQLLFEENPEKVRKKYASRSYFYLFFLVLSGSVIMYPIIPIIGFIVLLIKKIFSKKFYEERDKQLPVILTKDDVLFVVLIFIVFIGANLVTGIILIGITAIVSAIINIILSEFMPKRTTLGVLNKEKYEELKKWLKKHPLKEERLFNEFLGYSIVFGINNKWFKKFKSAVMKEKENPNMLFRM